MSGGREHNLNDTTLLPPFQVLPDGKTCVEHCLGKLRFSGRGFMERIESNCFHGTLFNTWYMQKTHLPSPALFAVRRKGGTTLNLLSKVIIARHTYTNACTVNMGGFFPAASSYENMRHSTSLGAPFPSCAVKHRFRPRSLCLRTYPVVLSCKCRSSPVNEFSSVRAAHEERQHFHSRCTFPICKK